MYSVESNVKPYITLRVAQILSHVTIGELMVARGIGCYIKRRLLKILARGACLSDEPMHALGDVSGLWRDFLQQGGLSELEVKITRGA
jgi:hypothetical protein